MCAALRAAVLPLSAVALLAMRMALLVLVLVARAAIFLVFAAFVVARISNF
jgi:hypothetical protein